MTVSWLLPWFLVCIGAATILRPAPVRQAPQLLRSFGRKQGLEFSLGADGRVAAEVAGQALLSQLIWRQARAFAGFLLSIGLAYLLVLSGPPLSQSTWLSLTVAVILCAGVLGSYLLLSSFLAPCAGRSGELRAPATAEAYLAPARRVVAWLAAGSAVSIPILIAVAASTSAYDGSKFYWESLVGLPLTAAAVLVATEIRSRALSDGLDDLPMTYAWDALRATAMNRIVTIAVLAVGLAWQQASQGLAGVALTSEAPEWAVQLERVATMLGLVFTVLAFLPLTAPRRFRRTLWPHLGNRAVRWV
jgi:hypothetical protein